MTELTLLVDILERVKKLEARFQPLPEAEKKECVYCRHCGGADPLRKPPAEDKKKEYNYCLGKSEFCCLHHPTFESITKPPAAPVCTCVDENKRIPEWHWAGCPMYKSPAAPEQAEKCECDNDGVQYCYAHKLNKWPPDQAVEEWIKAKFEKVKCECGPHFSGNDLRELVALARRKDSDKAEGK